MNNTLHVPRRHWQLLVLFGVLVGLLSNHAQGELHVSNHDQWSTVFSGTRVAFAFTVESAEAFKGRVAWKYSANQRSLARGEFKLDYQPGKPRQVSIPLQIPTVKDNVILRTELTLELIGDDDDTAATLEKPVWICPENPFADKDQWLHDLKIHLFDPDGGTADLFDAAEIPYSALRNLAVAEDLKDGILVVGEGASFIDHRLLAETLMEVAASGVPVLCLSPADGSIPLPSLANDELPVPDQMQWKRETAIRDLDKRLDWKAWPKGEVVTARLALDTRRGRVIASVDESGHGWPWLEIHYAGQGASLLVCGIGIVEGWEHSPTPRFLLARLLESLTAKPADRQAR